MFKPASCPGEDVVLFFWPSTLNRYWHYSTQALTNVFKPLMDHKVEKQTIMWRLRMGLREPHPLPGLWVLTESCSIRLSRFFSFKNIFSFLFSSRIILAESGVAIDLSSLRLLWACVAHDVWPGTKGRYDIGSFPFHLSVELAVPGWAYLGLIEALKQYWSGCHTVLTGKETSSMTSSEPVMDFVVWC